MTKTFEDILREMPEDDQREFYNTSYRFLKSIFRHFGNEGEEAVMAAVQGVLGETWGGELVMRKLTGEIHVVPTTITLTVNRAIWESNPHSPKINTIKIVRRIGGFGLKMSKDFVERAIDTGHAKLNIELFMGTTPELLKDMLEGRESATLDHLMNECSHYLYEMKQYGITGEVF